MRATSPSRVSCAPDRAPPKVASAQALRAAVGHVPKVSGRLRERTQQLADDPSALVERFRALLPQIDESYARLPPAVTRDSLESLAAQARMWCASLLTGEPPCADDFDSVAGIGRRRAHQGVMLAAVLRAVRAGAREIWCEFLTFAGESREVRDEVLFEVSRYVLEYFDIMSQTIAQAYLDELCERVGWRESLRYELSSIIFQSPEDVDGFHRTAEALGLDSTAPRIALVMDLRMEKDAPGRLEAELDRLTQAASRHLRSAYEDLVRVLHRDRLIIWFPCVRGDTVVAADRKALAGAAALLKSTPEIAAMGVGLMNHGPHGWAMSVEEAIKALDFGLRAGGGKRPHPYSEIAVNESVRRTDNVHRYLNSLLERLESEPELLITLQTYFDQQQRRKAAAAALGIHPNTLNYRLARVETILGADLEDAGWITRLHIALRLRQQSLPEPDEAT